MARPRKDPGEQRSETVKTAVTVAEKLFVQDQAQTAGLSESEYVRRRVLGYRVPPSRSPDVAALVSELNRIGVNVNQLAASAHMGRNFTRYADDIMAELEAILEKVSRIDGA